jgi:iron(III) transport system substrate-binding protein
MNIELHRHARLRALADASERIRGAPRQMLSLGATAVLFGGALAACGGSSAAATGPTATVPLVVYSAQGYDSVMTKAFQKATGIPVKLDDDSTGPLLAKVAAESNNPQWGLLWVDGDTAFASLDKQGQLLDYAPPVTLTSVGQSLVPTDRSYVPVSTTVMAAVIYNAAKVSAVPTARAREERIADEAPAG